MSIIVVGSTAFDDIETPKGKRDRIIGGSCIYFSLAACFRSNPRIVSVVGKDFSKNFFRELNKKGIDTSGLLLKDGKTFSWGGKYKSISEDPETKFTNLNVFENFQPIIPTSYKLKNKIVFLANIDPDLQNKVLDSLDSKKFIGMDTMNFWINSKRKSLDRAFERINLLTINELELGLITKKKSLEKSLEYIFNRYPIKFLVVKKGSSGSLLATRNSLNWIPCYPFAKMIDPTGAGDSFAGGLFSFLNNVNSFDKKNILLGMIYGSAIASFTIESFGTNKIFNLSKKEIDNRYKLLKKIAKII